MSLRPQQCRRLTGLDSSHLKVFADCMSGLCSHRWAAQVSFKDALIAFLIKLRHNMPFHVLSLSTGVPVNTLSRNFSTMLVMLSLVAQEVFDAKTKEDVMSRAGRCFSGPGAPGERTGLVIDAFEVCFIALTFIVCI